MKLIADSGSTKTEWCLVNNDKSTRKIITSGINPFYQSTHEILQNLHDDFPAIKASIDEIFFYGAGCGNIEKNKMVENALKNFFNSVKITINSDLLGTARSLCQEREGIACILGTGSNSCKYNGKYIEKNVSPLGYYLGDEGSGAIIGKKLVADILKNQLSSTTIELFFDTYKTKVSEIMENVYKKKFPNRYLAQFTKFISNNIEIEELERIVLFCFDEFVKRNLLQYDNIQNLKTNFVGSVAYYFNKQLKKIMDKNHLAIGIITQVPMEGLRKYHNV